MDLRFLTDNALLGDIKELSRRERKLTAEILHYLKEIDRRKLFADLKYSSLFEYCVKDLGYSESAAQRRILAARMLDELPELEIKIQDGSLSLSNIAKAASFLKGQEVETKATVLKEIENLSARECEKKLFELTGLEVPAKEGQRRINAEAKMVSIVLKDETIKALNECRSFLGKNLSWDELIFHLCSVARVAWEKKKFKLSDRPRKVSVPVGRVPTASLKREVYKRDTACIKCGSRNNLNFDHRIPYALGGITSSENIRLLCFNCNQRERIKNRL